MLENKCRSLAGMKLVEATSTGLSHSDGGIWPFADGSTKAISPEFFTTSETTNVLNFGNIVIDKAGTVTIEVKDFYGKIIEVRVLR